VPDGICYARVDGRTGRRASGDVPGTFTAPMRCGKEPEGAGPGGGLSLEDAQKNGGI
jgi:hypothetical protein